MGEREGALSGSFGCSCCPAAKGMLEAEEGGSVVEGVSEQQ